MKISLVPFNPVVGDLSGNMERALACIADLERTKTNLIVFPELALLGYPPQDLVLRTSFQAFALSQLDAFQESLKKIAQRDDLAVIIGTALASPEGSAQPLINAAVFIHKDQREVRAKSLIPHYDIFHERRYFESALTLEDKFRSPIEFLGKKIGLLICEDSWHDTIKYGRKVYSTSPSESLVRQGAKFLINLSASPFSGDKFSSRRKIIEQTAKQLSVPIAYVNLSGANDEIIFDGDAFVYSGEGRLKLENKRFSEQALSLDAAELNQLSIVPAQEESALEAVRRAIVTGIREYVRKNGFSSVLIGLSGGIDSALVAALAVEALGSAKVFGVTLPSKFSSSHSIVDAEQLAKNLGIKCQNLSIKFLQSTMSLALKPFFEGRPEDITEENLQARLRGMLLMAMANKFGHLLLATGNKSELAVGYSTLYGDMCGGLAPIGDLFKTDVYALAANVNKGREIIPKSSIVKAPSAELRPNQTDQDSLPAYAELDRMLHYLVEEEMSFTETLAALKAEGLSVDKGILQDIEARVWRSEFKRNQFSPILRVSSKAFGIGRRYPITKCIPDFVDKRAGN